MGGADRWWLPLLGMTRHPDHPLPAPICTMCRVSSAWFRVTEQHDRGWSEHLLCAECIRCRSWLWERFALSVKVERLQDRYEAS